MVRRSSVKNGAVARRISAKKGQWWRDSSVQRPVGGVRLVDPAVASAAAADLQAVGGAGVRLLVEDGCLVVATCRFVFGHQPK